MPKRRPAARRARKAKRKARRRRQQPGWTIYEGTRGILRLSYGIDIPVS